MTDGRIDLHQHLLPDVYLDAFRDSAPPGIRDWALPSWTRADALAMMDARGIATGVLSLSAPGVTILEGQPAAALARRVNEVQAELVKDRPDRFGMLATVPLPDVDRSLEVIAHAYDELRTDGVVLLANSHGVYLGDPRLDEVMAELDRRAAVVLVHPAVLPGPTVPGLTSAVVDFLLDTTRAAVNLALRGTTRRFPRIRFVLSHAGGFVPYAAWRIAELTPDFTDLGDGALTDPASVREALADFFYDTALSASPTALPSLLAFAGPDHVVFGSDWPYASPAVLDTFVDGQDALLPDDLTRRAVNRGTAERLLPRLAGPDHRWAA